MSPTNSPAKLVGFQHLDTFHRSSTGEYVFKNGGASLPNTEGVYALLAGPNVRYVGSANHVRHRLKKYLRRQNKATSIRPVHRHLQQELDRRDVDVYVRIFPKRVVNLDGDPVDLVIGVESGLIATLNPPWNRRGKTGIILETPTPIVG
jgi:hypothetical protein